MSQSCAICHHLQKGGGGATSLIGIATDLECVLGSAQARLNGGLPGKPHVMAHVCGDHAAAIYRGHVPGVTMAWRAATRA